jgi:flagellar motor switch protein FliN/FliY
MSDEEQQDPAAGGDAAALEPLESESAATAGSGEVSLDLLLDVNVTLSVEIGRTRMPIKELLSLTQGTVVELQRDINDPLDLMVNGTLIARGEVVESNGRFGLRLIDVVSPSERLKKLK